MYIVRGWNKETKELVYSNHFSDFDTAYQHKLYLEKAFPSDFYRIVEVI